MKNEDAIKVGSIGERSETASYTITNDFEGSLVARDSESGEIVAKIPSDTVVKHAKDSYDVIAEFGPALVGDVQAVEHDGEYIHVHVRIPAAGYKKFIATNLAK